MPQIKGKECYVISCSDDWKSIQKKMIKNTNECIESCENSNQYIFEYNGRCHENCPNGYLFDDNNQLNKCKCELNKCLTCPNVALNKNLCTECNDNYYPKENDPSNLGKYINCYKQTNGGEENLQNEETEYYDKFLKKIEQELTSDSLDTTDLDNGKDRIIEKDKLKITFTTTQNQKNNIYNNMTRVDIGDCETKLRNFYNIPENEILYMKKIDIIQDGMNALKVEYDVYAKLFGNNLINLNLTICGNSKISISIPITINDDLDKYNCSSDYYNDICYTTTSDDGTDIVLTDRQKEFINKDKVVCQEDCDFSEYDYDTLVAKCSCNAKDCVESFADMKINKIKLLENFKNIKNIINFRFLICYKKLFCKEGILKNFGSYILLLIILLYIISIFIFIIKHYPLLKKKIKNIIFFKKNGKDIKYKISKMYRLNTNKNSIHKKYNKKQIKKFSKNHKKILNDSKIKINSKFGKVKKEISNEFTDEEINGFSYDLALKYDNRNYFQYYSSLIKTQHNLINAFFNNNDYNCGIIKIDLFFIGFSIEYILNALFYNDGTMHKIYESKGDFDLETQIPIAVYSTIISTILNYPLNFLALSNDLIINFKQDNSKINISKKSKKLVKLLNIKFTLYFIISFLFLLFFWYYISMFGAIYKNTQIHLLKDTLIGFGLSLFIPFIFYLIPPIFRIPSLSNAHNKRQYLYNFSKFLQSF